MLKLKIQSISDIITNSSSEVFTIYTRDGINTFKEIISSLIGEDFDDVFILHIDIPDYDWVYEDYENSTEFKEGMSFEDWCLNRDSDTYEGSTYVSGFWVEAINPDDKHKAKMINQIYSLFESEERYY